MRVALKAKASARIRNAAWRSRRKRTTSGSFMASPLMVIRSPLGHGSHYRRFRPAKAHAWHESNERREDCVMSNQKLARRVRISIAQRYAANPYRDSDRILLRNYIFYITKIKSKLSLFSSVDNSHAGVLQSSARRDAVCHRFVRHTCCDQNAARLTYSDDNPLIIRRAAAAAPAK